MLTLLLATSFLMTGQRAEALTPAPPPAVAAPASFGALGFPAGMSKETVRGLLQSFADAGWGRRFRELGDEADFDHGHILLDARTGAPRAVLYHTRELDGSVREGRNWLQWLDGRGIQDAGAYERTAYPRGADWDWFVARDLPRLRARGTILDRMLDPERLGFTPAPARQWTFTRTACGPAADAPDGAALRLSRPDGAAVCVALGALL